MNEVGMTMLTVIISAFVGSVTTLFVEKTKLKYRLQVENEYKILMRIWEKAYWLKSRANNLRPLQDRCDLTELPTDRHKRRLGQLENAMNEFEQEMYLNKPFYPQEIHDLLKELKTLADMEGFGYAETSPNRGDHNYRSEYWEEAKKNAANIDGVVDRICNAIQHRIHENPSDAM
ncbi:MAG: hypothetical protein WD851_08010 [Pirellulales bacterium]